MTTTRPNAPESWLPVEASAPEAVLAQAVSVIDSLLRDGVTRMDPLADGLYTRWYAGMEDEQLGAAAAPDPGDPILRAGSLLPAFRAAHARAGEAESGWLVVASDPKGVATVMRAGQMRQVRPGEYISSLRPGVPVAPGEQVEIVARFDRFDPDRQLWWSFSSRLPEGPLGRLYLNVRPAAAPRAIAQITAALAMADVDHQLKCPVVPQSVRRTDAVVIYHERRCREITIDALLQRWLRLGSLLDDATPPLTRRVRAGLAWADDDGKPDRSFGELRCRAIIAAVVGAHSEWAAADAAGRLEIVTQGLRAAGIDPVEPWLACR